MSLTSTSAVIALKAVEMRDLREILETDLRSQQYRTYVESMNDSELMLKISRSRFKTIAMIQRLRHRPLEVVIEVDYTKTEIPLQVNRDKQSNRTSRSSMSYRWIWLLFIFSGIIISALTTVSEVLNSFINSTGLSDFQLIGIMMVVFVSLPLLVIYGIPGLQKRLNSGKRLFDQQVLTAIATSVRQLQAQLTSTEILRCWSCFKEIDFEDKICAFCGETQKSA